MNVTYLLGAGASANALPIVANFEERFSFFLDLFKEKCIAGRFDDSDKKLVSEFIEKINSELRFQYSIDTYARKFFFQDLPKYEALKILLSYYFMFEQMDNNAIITPIKSLGTSGGTVGEWTELHGKIERNIDNRYDAFFAALLDEKTKALRDNIRFISWNYDYQLELSYSKFINTSLGEAFNNLESFPGPSHRIKIKSENARVVRLNGIAGLFYVEDQKKNSGYGFRVNPNIPFVEISLEKCYDDVLGLLKGHSEWDSLLEFAWENETECNAARERAKEIMAITDHLIIIGYSFPNYNRKIDRELFSAFRGRKQITYQVIKEHYEDYKQRLGNLYSFINEPDILKPYYDTGQFFIPDKLL